MSWTRPGVGRNQLSSLLVLFPVDGEKLAGPFSCLLSRMTKSSCCVLYAQRARPNSHALTVTASQTAQCQNRKTGLLQPDQTQRPGLGAGTGQRLHWILLSCFPHWPA